MRFRRVTPDDEPFLERMMLSAGFPPEQRLGIGSSSQTHVRWFCKDWGRKGDVGVIALDEAGLRLGAAWARRLRRPLLRDADGVAVGELAIAVEVHARGSGIGAALLRELQREAAAEGHRELSLRVSNRSPAVRLYERAGYERVEDGEQGIVMRLRF
jgi:ribosomal protein S18 acetylase RimI-like enzyme